METYKNGPRSWGFYIPVGFKSIDYFISEQIKELNLTSDEDDENDEGTIIEKLSEEEVTGSVVESLEEVNSILTGIDRELGMNELNLESTESKEVDSDSLKDEKAKKTISFRLDDPIPISNSSEWFTFSNPLM